MDRHSLGEGRGEGRGDTLADMRDDGRKLTAGDILVGERHDEIDKLGESLGEEWVT